MHKGSTRWLSCYGALAAHLHEKGTLHNAEALAFLNPDGSDQKITPVVVRDILHDLVKIGKARRIGRTKDTRYVWDPHVPLSSPNGNGPQHTRSRKGPGNSRGGSGKAGRAVPLPFTTKK